MSFAPGFVANRGYSETFTPLHVGRAPRLRGANDNHPPQSEAQRQLLAPRMFRCAAALARAAAVALTVALAWALIPAPAWAAPCCGGGVAAPTLISGDHAAQLNFGAGFTQVVMDAPEQGLPTFRDGAAAETTTTLRLEGAALVTDRWQLGASAPLLLRQSAQALGAAAAARLGDLRATAGYEVLPEWEYSAWRPVGVSYVQLTLPTGTSLHEARELGLVDASGQGFTTVGAGVLLTKTWGTWDAVVMPEGSWSFARTFTPPDGSSLQVNPGPAAAVLLGLGVSPGGGRLRLGLRIQPVWRASREVTASGETRTTAPQRWIDVGADVAWRVTDAWTVVASYQDQTLLGPVQNALLSRGVGLLVQRRWER